MGDGNCLVACGDFVRVICSNWRLTFGEGFRRNFVRTLKSSIRMFRVR